MVRSGLALGVACVAGFASSASAGFITITYNNTTPSRSVSISTNSGSQFNNITAGKANFTGDTNNPVGLQGMFMGFCLELAQSVSAGNTYTSYYVEPLTGVPDPGSNISATKADRIAELWGEEYANLDTADEFAAFQVAIWEIVTDNTLSLTGGTFRVGSGTVRTLATSMLLKVDGQGPRAAGLFAIASEYKQDFVVPAPGSGVLALGGILLGLSRRRRA